MKRIIPFFLLCCIGYTSLRAQQNKTDMTVFGFTLGTPFSIPECPCTVGEVPIPVMTGKPFEQFDRYKGYTYVVGQPAKGVCFRRKNLEKYTVRRKKQLDSLPPVTNESVEICFSRNEAPAISPTGTIDALVSKGNLQAISFVIYSADASKDFDILKNKYGSNANIESFKLQNDYGASLEYYKATWDLPGLKVILLSSLHRTLSETFGQIFITQASTEPKPQDHRPL